VIIRIRKRVSNCTWTRTTANSGSVSGSVLQREANLTEAFKRSGVDALSLSTGEDMVRAIVGFAKLRQQRRKVS
jgi:hypothetical protein